MIESNIQNPRTHQHFTLNWCDRNLHWRATLMITIFLVSWESQITGVTHSISTHVWQSLVDGSCWLAWILNNVVTSFMLGLRLKFYNWLLKPFTHSTPDICERANHKGFLLKLTNINKFSQLKKLTHWLCIPDPPSPNKMAVMRLQV